MSVIDIHAHYVPKGWADLGEATGDRSHDWPWLRVDSEKEAMMMVGDKEFRPITHNSWNAEVRLKEMDADGVDFQVMSPTPLFFTYEESGKTSATIARIFNDEALKIAEQGEGRLIPFCQVPLQDTEEAIKELDRCVANGHRGVEIGNHVGDRDLDDAGIVDFLAHAAELDVPVFVHPWDMAESPRLNRWMARWLAGMPQETHLSIISLILGGAFDRLPKNLKLAFAHSGGSFPYWLGRFENAWHRRPDLIAKSEFSPSHYLDRFSVDTVVFQEASLRLLVDVLGEDHVMLGSDYPYPLGETPVGTVVREASFLTDEQEAKILGGNAQRFLGMK
ncbi:amidohydrolase family protein [Rothia aerolata]|uniref:2-amino-3-carboxymuconate-6-semialdehyde decarboxylase n=1 Tax=Rothia aerolata TaxID=1812262 RepID=A0A917MSC3_9MICC|nr:amidohydrolase family protein [Rothia aerolata]GGH61252.1 2-hydroxy-3-carboxy-6-oxo-7-methylocta-2,4-dienoate decarboxylase [Rothia aerolata]